ncbi:MAG TPA: preprotein translocase subunit SecE [Anaerovoracaceae bacterium]|nr:preprotein translocase subunit SecE [Anaerovoracaceae bacterium]
MEKEKAKKPVPVAPKKQKGSVKDYFKGVRTEVKKVVWPTRKELVSYTGVVLFACVLLGLGIWLVDSAFLASLKYVLNISF